MLRLLMFIALVAAVSGLYDFAGMQDAFAGPGLARAAGSLDVRSFGMGFAVALTLATMQRIPWNGLPAMLRDWLRGWRRVFQLAVLAALLVGVLMYY